MVFALVVRFGAVEAVVTHVWQADQFVGELVLVPLLSFLTIMLGMMISSRTSDMRVAQQLSGLVILPMVLGYVLIAVGIVRSSVPLYVFLGIVLGWVDVIMWKLLRKMFHRERLLTRFGAGA